MNSKTVLSKNLAVPITVPAEKLLPENYDFKILKTEHHTGNGMSLVVRLNVNTKEEVISWVKEFENKNHITLRVLQTYQDNTQKIIFKKEYRCMHNTRPSKGSTPHLKHTKCTAKITVTLKNSNMKSDLPEDQTTVLLLGVTRIPTSPLVARRPLTLPLHLDPSPNNEIRSTSRVSFKRRQHFSKNKWKVFQEDAGQGSFAKDITQEKDGSLTSSEVPPTNIVDSQDITPCPGMDKSVDSIGTCSLDIDASADVAGFSEGSSVATLRSISVFTPSPEPYQPSYLSLACTINGYSTTTNYDPERLSRSREVSPHRPFNNDNDLKSSKTYTVQNNLLSPPNLVPLPTNRCPMADQTITTHQQMYSSSKTMTFMSAESHSFVRSIYMSDTVDSCYENGLLNRNNKLFKQENKTNEQCKYTETIKESVINRESKSFIQQRVERLYGPGALAQGFFVSKRQHRANSESENEKPRLVVPTSEEKRSVSMCDKLLKDDYVDTSMKQSTSSPTLPVLRHLRPEFRAQLPIIKSRKSNESVLQKSITIPKLTQEVKVNGHSENGKDDNLCDNNVEILAISSKIESDEKDGHYFSQVLAKEATRLLALADYAERESETDHLSEEVKGKLRSAYGKARLLVSQKMEQFKGLCSNNINQGKDEQYPTTNEDLQGFWDMVMLQVVQVNALFDEIENLKENNWQIKEDNPDKKINGSLKKAAKKISARPKTAGSEELRKQRDAQRKQIMEQRRKAMKSQALEDKDIEIFVPESS